MKTRAAVAFAPKQPLEIVEVDLEGPKQGEVLVEIMATGICHTDAYTLDGFDSEGIFPSILGHEGAGVVREVGPGVTSVKAGDHVIPLYTPECRQCKSCLSGKTNLCTAIRATQGKGVMPDGTSRFSYKGETIYPLHGLLDLLELHRAAGDRRREDPRGRAVQDQLLHRLRRHHGRRRGGEDREGRAGRQRRRVRPRRHRPQRHPGREDGRREPDRRRRHQPRPRGMGPQVRHDRLPQQQGHEPRGYRRQNRRDHRRRRRLYVRRDRQHRSDAHRARNAATAAGARASSSASPKRARRSPPGRSSWSPAATGAAPRSAAPRAAPTCPRSSTGTWTGRSRSTR